MPKPALPPGTMLEKYRGEVPSWDSPDTDEVYEAFFEPVKPRDNPEFQQALAASTDKRFREYLRQLNLPKNRNKKCSTIAKVMDISLAEFVDFLRTSYRAQAMSVAAMRLPEITIHMANDALTQKEACGRCDGWGFVNVTPEEVPILEEGQPIPGGVRPMGDWSIITVLVMRSAPSTLRHIKRGPAASAISGSCTAAGRSSAASRALCSASSDR